MGAFWSAATCRRFWIFGGVASSRGAQSSLRDGFHSSRLLTVGFNPHSYPQFCASIARLASGRLADARAGGRGVFERERSVGEEAAYLLLKGDHTLETVARSWRPGRHSPALHGW